MSRLTLQQVNDPTHLSFIGIEPGVPPAQDTSIAIEIYAGNIAVQFENNDGMIVPRNDTCLIPIDKTTLVSYPLSDQDSKLVEITTCVSIANFTTAEDEANLVAVNSAFVKLERQSFPGVSGSPLCLVLHVHLAVLNSNIRSIAYNIAVKGPRGRKIISDLNADTAPA
jgi:hypothetical protein